jgi:hypothetical protein
MQNIMYGAKCQPMKYKSYYDEACYAYNGDMLAKLTIK